MVPFFAFLQPLFLSFSLSIVFIIWNFLNSNIIQNKSFSFLLFLQFVIYHNAFYILYHKDIIIYVSSNVSKFYYFTV